MPGLELDKGAHTIPATADILTQKRAILSASSASIKSLSASVSSFSLNRDKVLGGAVDSLKAASDLINDPLFQQIVSRGAPAVAHILDDYASSGAHGKDIWVEALKQIHEIEKERGGEEGFPEQMREFETWLASYTGQTTPAEEPVEGQTEATASEPEADTAAEPEVGPESAETAPQ